MTANNFTTSILVEKSPTEVYNAINNVRGWWSEEIEGITNQVDEEWTYHYKDVHICRMRIIELIPGKKIVWLVVDNQFSFTKDKTEWTGDTIIFDITEEGNNTKVQMTQIGLVPENECFDVCQHAWNTYVQKSLYNLITTGKGQPNGKDNPQTDDEKRFDTSNFTVTFFVDQKPREVFNAVNNVRGWWQGDIEGSTSKLNDEFTYRMKDIHYSKQQIVDIVLDKRIVWLVTDSELSFLKKKNEWTGTTIIFEIAEINNKTELRFTHQGLFPEIECYGSCSVAWGNLIRKSLYSLITTGKGTEVFN